MAWAIFNPRQIGPAVGAMCNGSTIRTILSHTCTSAGTWLTDFNWCQRNKNGTNKTKKIRCIYFYPFFFR